MASVSAFFLAAGPARTDALLAYRLGEYQKAIALGQAEASAASLVLAARSHLALVDIEKSQDRKADIKAALKAARLAAELDDSNIEAHLMQVAALGFLGRGMGKMKSFRKGLAPKSHRQIKTAITLDPGSPWPYAMLGMWHLEIVRRGGAFGARMTGANMHDGAEACAYAVGRAPKDAALGALCGMALLAVGKRKLVRQAQATLIQARDVGRPRSAYDAVLQGRAAEILALWANQGLDAARLRAIYYESNTSPKRKVRKR